MIAAIAGATFYFRKKNKTNAGNKENGNHSDISNGKEAISMTTPVNGKEDDYKPAIFVDTSVAEDTKVSSNDLKEEPAAPNELPPASNDEKQDIGIVDKKSLIPSQPAAPIVPQVGSLLFGRFGGDVSNPEIVSVRLNTFAKVAYPFTRSSGGTDEIDLNLGNEVFVELAFADGWAVGTNISNGMYGLFPADVLDIAGSQAEPEITERKVAKVPKVDVISNTVAGAAGETQQAGGAFYDETK